MKVDRNFKLGNYCIESINSTLCSGDLNPPKGLEKRLINMNKYIISSKNEFLNYLKRFINKLISEINLYKTCLKREDWESAFWGRQKNNKEIKNNLFLLKKSLKLVIKDYRKLINDISTK
ncbi:hypothetical protein [Brevundimonas sp. FT23042]|uniref:hypothetical protein n=1 Tax=Brevundimonas sp. FT23042 TaxID=3393749 RepID=UPI003B58811C